MRLRYGADPIWPTHGSTARFAQHAMPEHISDETQQERTLSSYSDGIHSFVLHDTMEAAFA